MGAAAAAALGDRNHPAKREKPLEKRGTHGGESCRALGHCSALPGPQTSSLALSPFPKHPWSTKGAAGGYGRAGTEPSPRCPLQGAGTGRSPQVCAHSRARAELIPGSRARPPTGTHISRAGHCSSSSTGHEKAGRGLALQPPSSHIPLEPVKSHNSSVTSSGDCQE